MTNWAVVTGASGGLGAAFAQRLAREGHNVVLAARSEDKMNAIAQRLNVETKVYPVDLCDREARAEFGEFLSGLNVSCLINNAGFGTVGDFAEIDAKRVSSEVELDVVALTELSRIVLPGMIERGRGALINIASGAAFQPMPTMAVYAAAKSYVLNLTVALWDELYDTGVRALAMCPGPTSTSFFAEAGDNDAMKILGRRKPEQVVDTAFEALAAHKPYVIDGWSNKLLALSTKFGSLGTAAKVARKLVAN